MGVFPHIHIPLCFLRLRRPFMFIILLTILSLSLSCMSSSSPCLTVFLVLIRSFNNFANKSSEELKDLLLTAITEQKRQLLASLRSSNGETGTPASCSSPNKKKKMTNPTDTALTELYKWVQKVNAKKADKEAAKMLQ